VGKLTDASGRAHAHLQVRARPMQFLWEFVAAPAT
jgi:hypothetical protein